MRCSSPEFTAKPGWIEPKRSICMAFRGLQGTGMDLICVYNRYWLWSSIWPFGIRGTLYKEGRMCLGNIGTRIIQMASFGTGGGPRNRLPREGKGINLQCVIPPGVLARKGRCLGCRSISGRRNQVWGNCMVGERPDSIGSFSHSVSGNHPPRTFTQVIPETHKNSLKSSDKGLARGFQLICQFQEFVVIVCRLC